MAEMSHLSENTIEPTEPILFFTPFGYLFPDAAKEPACLLDVSRKTVDGLIALGQAMGDPGKPKKPLDQLNSKIPSLFTYFGQFIDHDLTIRTDGDGTVTAIEKQDRIYPIPPETVCEKLMNGRRPFLDLDSVYGDGPSLSKGAQNLSDKLYDDYRFKVQCAGKNKHTGYSFLDLYRHKNAEDEPIALIADERNDENINVSQIHASMLNFHNVIMEVLSKSSALGKTSKENFVLARKWVRWTYQYIVANQYLKLICDSQVVEDTLCNGPRFLGSVRGHGGVFMPLEFSVAAFRFGHSMIRPFYQLNKTTQKGIMDLLLPSHKNPKTGNINGSFTQSPLALSKESQIDWSMYLDFQGTKPLNMARRIDPLLAVGLFDLPTAGRQKSLTLSHLAISNLLRGYSLSIPTGQAACKAFGIAVLSPAEILAAASDLDKVTKSDKPLAPVLEHYCFHEKTPLWFYILLEAHAQRQGLKLGALGGRIICETLVGLLKADPNSYLNAHDPRITPDGILLPQFNGSDRLMCSFQDVLGYSGLFK